MDVDDFADRMYEATQAARDTVAEVVELYEQHWSRALESVTRGDYATAISAISEARDLAASHRWCTDDEDAAMRDLRRAQDQRT